MAARKRHAGITPNHRYRQAMDEMREHLQLNEYPDADEEDALEALMGDCGMGPDGFCTKVGSEECEFECPFS